MTPLKLMPTFLWKYLTPYTGLTYIDKLHRINSDYHLIFNGSYINSIIHNKLKSGPIELVIHGPMDYRNGWLNMIDNISTDSMDNTIKSCDVLTKLGIICSIQLSDGVFDISIDKSDNYVFVGIGDNVVLRLSNIECRNVYFDNVNLKFNMEDSWGNSIDVKNSVTFNRCHLDGHTDIYCLNVSILSCIITGFRYQIMSESKNGTSYINIIGNVMTGYSDLVVEGSNGHINLIDNFVHRNFGVLRFRSVQQNILIKNNVIQRTESGFNIQETESGFNIYSEKTNIVLINNVIDAVYIRVLGDNRWYAPNILLYSGNKITFDDNMFINKASNIPQAKIFYTHNSKYYMYRYLIQVSSSAGNAGNAGYPIQVSSSAGNAGYPIQVSSSAGNAGYLSK